MKPENISDAIGRIDDKIVVSADEKRKKRKSRKTLWIKICAAAACVALVVTAVLGRNIGSDGLVTNAYAIVEAEYPDRAKYPDDESFDGYEKWEEDRVRLEYRSELESFFADTAYSFLGEAEGENRVYSPINVYMALSMLAEITDGGSREQILTLLDMQSVEDLRKAAENIWSATYCDDGRYVTVLANSIWLRDDISYKKPAMTSLAENYYASSFSGEMGSEDYNKALQEWLNEQTGGLLEEQAGEMKMDPETVIALASTVYFKAMWSSKFSEENTVEDIFNADSGDVTCDFMNKTSDGVYYWGDNFSATTMYMRNAGKMWLILPDEGVTVDEVLADGDIMDMMFGENWENAKHLMVNLSVPKFDVVSSMDISDNLKELGVTNVFDPSVSNFSPLTDDVHVPIYVEKVNHSARVTIDEEGCTAAAFTVIQADGAGMPPDDEVDFVVDRPFIFVITSEYGAPLFAGVVNQPAG